MARPRRWGAWEGQACGGERQGAWQWQWEEPGVWMGGRMELWGAGGCGRRWTDDHGLDAAHACFHLTLNTRPPPRPVCLAAIV